MKFRSAPCCNKSILTSYHHRNCDDGWLLIFLIYNTNTNTHTKRARACTHTHAINLFKHFNGVNLYTNTLTRSLARSHSIWLRCLRKYPIQPPYHMCVRHYQSCEVICVSDSSTRHILFSPIQLFSLHLFNTYLQICKWHINKIQNNEQKLEVFHATIPCRDCFSDFHGQHFDWSNIQCGQIGLKFV